jgi:phosphatidylglycerophosphatase A
MSASPEVTAARRPDAGFLLRRPSRFVALGFGSGLSPIAPGTIGTLAGWLAFVLIDPLIGDLHWGLLILAALAYGVPACGRVAAELGGDDPGPIVWDEIVAFWIVLWVARPEGFAAGLGAFALFRFFDAVKPPPIGHIDRTVTGPVGIFADDLAAAAATLLALALWSAWP